MGKVIPKRGLYARMERFCFETEEEREFLECARNYFQSMRLFLLVGLGRDIGGSRSSGGYYRIKQGVNRKGARITISLEEFKLISIYAMRHIDGEIYDEATFERPVL